MSRRRKIVAIVLSLLLVATVISALTSNEKRATKPENLPPGPASAVDPGTAGLGEGVVRGELPADEVVRARVGDLVELTVTAPGADSATIETLGLVEALAPGAPARFSFYAHREGTFPVRLEISSEGVGSVVVKPAAERRRDRVRPRASPAARRDRG